MAEKTKEPVVEDVEETPVIIEEGDEVEVIETGTEEEEQRLAAQQSKLDSMTWTPKTSNGKMVKDNKLNDIDILLKQGKKVLEAEIVEVLLPDIETDLLLVGQSKGKFGGGQRRIFRQTQKKTNEGNKPKFLTFAVVGNKKGYIGSGYGKSKETVPAREKALRRAKLNMIKIRRGCGSWQCNCTEAHSIPFKVSGKCGSSQITLIPAPKGKGLCIEPECKKMLAIAGIQDVWARTKGQTKTKINLLNACFAALKNLSTTKVPADVALKLNINVKDKAKTAPEKGGEKSV